MTSLAAALWVAFTTSAYAVGGMVIVNNDNQNVVNKAVIKKIFKGDMTLWPNGGPVVALDLPAAHSVRAAFTSSVLGKSLSSIKALWAKNIFTGKATPSRVAGSDEEVKKAVAGNKNAIGYIKASSLDGSVKGVLKF